MNIDTICRDGRILESALPPLRVPSGTTLPVLPTSNQIFRLLQDDGQYVQGLYIFDGDWLLVPQYAYLQDGTPAYTDAYGFRSIATQSFQFALSGSAKNVYLNSFWTASNTVGYLLPRNSILISATVLTSSASASSAAYQVRKNKSTAPELSITHSQGLSKSVHELGMNFTELDEISVYCASSAAQRDPIVTLTFAWRD